MANLYLCPYIKKYIDSFNDTVQYDIVEWNRHDVVDDECGAENFFVYTERLDNDAPKYEKLFKILRYAGYVKKIIEKNEYSLVIFLHNILAIFMTLFLVSKYRRKYVIDIRDYSYEKVYPFFALEGILTKHSALNVISSPGYKYFLPKGEYVMVHNDSCEYTNKICDQHNTQLSLPINIAFIGTVRFFEQNKKIFELIKHDNGRFKLTYAGYGSSDMKRFIGNPKDVTFLPQFSSKDTLTYYRNVDIINNVYGNDSLSLKYAYSNKLYYAAHLRKPIIVSPKTYMADIVSQYGIGFVFNDKDPRVLDNLFDYYKSIDYEKFERNCDAFLETVNKESEIFSEKIRLSLE